jgi:hypothetical protein
MVAAAIRSGRATPLDGISVNSAAYPRHKPCGAISIFEPRGTEQSMSTFIRIAPWLILGPITGLLAEGIYRNIKRSNPGLASLYGVALMLSWYNLGVYGGGAVITLKHWFL